MPADFDIDGLEPSERRVLSALVDATSDAWLFLPQVHFVDRGRDGEADLVAINAERGVVVIEVKGGAVSSRDGTWFQDGRRLKRSPVVQAKEAKYALLTKAQQVADADDVSTLWFAHAVAFPDVDTVPDQWLGPDLDLSMVLSARELGWADQALDAILELRAKPASSRTMAAVLRALRPDVDFKSTAGPGLGATTRRLDDQTSEVLRIAENLDANLRVFVEGPAGSGKTRLAIRWARRARERGERVLLLCFNLPMGNIFQSVFQDDDEVTAGSFHQFALDLLAPTGFETPDPVPADFWDVAVPTALFDRRESLSAGFDTIILDEAQDIRPHWYPAIEGLLDPDGARRLYRVGDRTQNVYRVEQDEGDGWVTFPLQVNCRNTKAIAAVAQRVGGGETFSTSPDGPPVNFLPVGGLKELRKRVNSELLTLRRDHSVAPSDVAVITTRADLRDKILDPPLPNVQLVRWDVRDEKSIVCETAHRLKGTEWQAVVLASLEPAVTNWLPEILYVGVSRPTTWLSVVAPRDTGQLLGLVSGPS